MFYLSLCDLVLLLGSFPILYSMTQSILLLIFSILTVLPVSGRAMDRSNTGAKIAVLLIGGIAAGVAGLVVTIPMTY